MFKIPNYKGISYDPKIDYQSQINKTTDPTQKSLQNLQRTAKIYDTKMENQYGSVPSDLQYLKPTIQQQPTTLNKSKTQYSDQITNMLGQLSESLKTPLTNTYKPKEDVSFQAAQKEIGDSVYNQLARRNIADSSITGDRAYELSMQSLPQFQQMYKNNQQQDFTNKANMLNQLQSLDSNDFQKTQALEQLQLQRGNMTGDYLTAEQQQQIENIDPSLNKYVDNYQQEINRRAAINPNDPSILQLQYLRNQKIKDLGLTFPQSTLGQQTSTQKQFDFTKQQTMAGLTGQYISPEQQNIVNNGVTGEDEQRIKNISSQFGGYAEYIQKLDPNSAEYTKVQMLMGQTPGTQTMQGQQFDLQQQLGKEDLYSARMQNKYLPSQLQLQQDLGQEQLYSATTQNQFLVEQLQASLTGQELQNAGQTIANSINSINLEYLPQEKQIALDGIRQSLDKGDLDIAYQKIINANLPEQITAELNQAFAQTGNIYANTNRTNLESSLLGQGGTSKEYTQTDVNNNVSNYLRTFGKYDKIDKKWSITDKDNNGIPDNQGKILDQMSTEYSRSPNNNTYDYLQNTANKLGISNSDFVKNMAKIQNSNNSSLGRSGVVSLAQKYTGTKYVWGGNSLSKGVDCSGLTQQVYKNAGIDLPRTAYEQSKVTTTISQKQMKPGDLIFFDTVQNNGKPVDHVGIYAGDGKMTHASSSKGVVTVPMTTSYWQSKLTKVGRP